MNPISFGVAYIEWHYSQAFGFILQMWIGAQRTTNKLFSIGDLLRTLFSPLLRIQERHEGRFDLAEYGSVMASNLIMRCVGAFIRIVLVVIGIVAWAMVFLAGLVFYVVWAAAPVVMIASFIYGCTFFI